MSYEILRIIMIAYRQVKDLFIIVRKPICYYNAPQMQFTARSEITVSPIYAPCAIHKKTRQKSRVP